jgi:CarD family transcriptional regulator
MKRSLLRADSTTPSPRWCATCSARTRSPSSPTPSAKLYEAALDRLSREVAAVQRITETEAIKEIEAALAKGPRRGPKPTEEEAVVEDEAA